MKDTISIRMDSATNKMLENVLKKSGKKKSDFIREAIKRQIAIENFEQIRSGVLPFAEAQGLLTDEDVWNLIS